MFCILLFLTAFTFSFGQPEWSYRGETGPTNWPDLYPLDCSLSSQSPINIDYYSTKFDRSLRSMVFEGYDQTLPCSEIENTGRTVEILPNCEGNRPSISGGDLPGCYRMENFHFHWGSVNSQGSEHSINRKFYAMECHLVHMNVKYETMEEALKHKDGVAVLAVFFRPVWRGCSNPIIKEIANTLKDIRYPENKTEFHSEHPIELLLPPKESRHFYRYAGSLTTPNCTQAVIWTVFPTSKEIGISELDKFRSVYETKDGSVPLVDNYRPTQPINGRQIYRNWY